MRQSIPIPRCRYLVGVAAALSLGVMTSRARAEPPPPRDNVTLGPLIGIVQRTAKDPSGVHYLPGIAFGGAIRLPIVPWLGFSIYYLKAYQGVNIDYGALGTGVSVTTGGHLSSYVIGGRLQPTWRPIDRLQLWVSVGGGWGVATAPALHVDAASPYDVPTHDAVFVELPIGIGADYQIIPRWMSANVEASVGPVLAQEGQFGNADRVQSITSTGRIVYTRSIPELNSSWTLVAGIALRL